MRFWLIVLMCLPAARAQAQVDYSGLNIPNLVQLISDSVGTTSHAVTLYYDGRLVGDWTFGNPPTAVDIEGITATVTSQAVGLMLADGSIPSLDFKMMEIIPEWKDKDQSAITVKHLLANNSGLAGNTRFDERNVTASDLYDFAVKSRMVRPVGERVVVNPRNASLIALLVKTRTGKSLDLYLQEKLFTPLGITEVSWSKDGAGNIKAYSGLRMRAGDLAKIGLLMLNDGLYEGKQILPKGWVAETLAPVSKEQMDQAHHWYRIHMRTEFIVDEPIIEKLRAAELDAQMITRLEALKGRYPGRMILLNTYMAHFGVRYDEILAEFLNGNNILLTRSEFSEYMGVNASGTSGQWLVILPEAKMVGVRLIDKAKVTKPRRDAYSNFGNNMIKLTNKESN